MKRLIGLAVIVIGVAGCASSAPEATAQPVGDVAEPTTVNKSVAAAQATEATPADGEIEFMEAPPVEQLASVPETRDEMICKRVQMTGSHRMEKICRPRSEVETTMREHQEVIRRMERSTANSAR